MPRNVFIPRESLLLCSETRVLPFLREGMVYDLDDSTRNVAVPWRIEDLYERRAAFNAIGKAKSVRAATISPT